MEVIRTGTARIPDSLSANGDLITTLLHAASFVRQRLGEFLERFDLTEGRYLTLDALLRAGVQGLSQTDVAEYLVQSESNVSSVIDRLQRDGLVDRSWSVTDRRKRVLLLTEAGHELVDRVNVARQRWEESLLSKVSPLDRGSVLRSLSQIVARSEQTTAATPASNIAERVDWPSHGVVPRRDPNSPHFALEQMLSTLGLAGRFAEDER